MTQAHKPPDDSFQIRCPRLGQQIHFSYCRRENIGLPCLRALDCWYMHFNIVAYFKQELTDAQWHDAFEKPPTPKILSLAELIEKAQARAKEEK